MQLGLYKHYKGLFYQVLGIGRHTETLEIFVIYKALDDQGLWIRPIEIFQEEVEVNGQKMPRFKFVKKFEEPL